MTDNSLDPSHAIDDRFFYEPDNSLPEFEFSQLPDFLRNRVAELGWTTPTPVQAKAIPYIYERRDITVQARTGSGKTAAYLLPILDTLRLKEKWCQALILVPTRELARQVTAVRRPDPGAESRRANRRRNAGARYRPCVQGHLLGTARRNARAG